MSDPFLKSTVRHVHINYNNYQIIFDFQGRNYSPDSEVKLVVKQSGANTTPKEFTAQTDPSGEFNLSAAPTFGGYRSYTYTLTVDSMVIDQKTCECPLNETEYDVNIDEKYIFNDLSLCNLDDLAKVYDIELSSIAPQIKNIGNNKVINTNVITKKVNNSNECELMETIKALRNESKSLHFNCRTFYDLLDLKDRKVFYDCSNINDFDFEKIIKKVYEKDLKKDYLCWTPCSLTNLHKFVYKLETLTPHKYFGDSCKYPLDKDCVLTMDELSYFIEDSDKQKELLVYTWKLKADKDTLPDIYINLPYLIVQEQN